MKKIILMTFFLSVFVYAETKDWVAKIETRVITVKEFQSLYQGSLDLMELQGGGGDLSKYKNNKQYQAQFLEGYIASTLLTARLKEENKTLKFVNEAWIHYLTQKIVENTQNQMYVKAYIDKVLSKKVAEPTDKQIEEVYNKHKSEFKDATATQAAEFIKKRLKQQEAMKLLEKKAEKIRGETRIFRNDEYFEK